MSAGIVLVTGSSGLVGSAAARCFAREGYEIWGVDNDARGDYFGRMASTRKARESLLNDLPGYRHFDVDIRSEADISRIVSEADENLTAVIHAAAQPSHDWAARDPLRDFDTNARATLLLLEAVRRYSPNAIFIFLSTNKVYGDLPNRLPLVELPSRWEISEDHEFHANGIDESMSIDTSTHSLFGVSKASADLLVQEYGRYFGMRSACFRCGCLTGPAHAGAPLHGFLAYLVQAVVRAETYTIHGYGGKQVRDNLHANDLAEAFVEFVKRPRIGEVYNMGGGRFSNISVREAITRVSELTGRDPLTTCSDTPRIGDHVWWISDIAKFRSHYPDWRLKNDLDMILQELCEAAANTA